MTPTISRTLGRSTPLKTIAAPERWRFNLANTRLNRSTSRQMTARLSTNRSTSRFGLRLGLAPQPRARRNQADDTALAFDDDRAQIVGVFRADGILQRRSGLGHDETPFHDVLRLLDQIKIDVPLLGDAVAAMAQLDRIDGFADQRAPDAGGDRDRDDDRNDDGVIAGHLEHHDDGGHDAAGSGAHHRGHADDRRRRRGDAGMGKTAPTTMAKAPPSVAPR